ncbi:hypothetical protein BGZ61DRAFT_499196 [Ilyonectria robusta]|uniref:uncharacterized protein n=1 Tax=Ilyonectria robusta TaxID=1079257 RepID=UPI001E8CF35B|nr:uncharacterized protein BGZ61DRAFT_499196 [Ilyonectria robusta]KAH8663874.1 hypothetical protein BGZ61DRAFT_499196 [Ilyonectria robusta]
MQPSSRLLLRGGTVLMHDARDHVRAVRRDILIENNEISKISSIIRDCADADIIDCHMKIISPGFVDTHHHLWQTQLKGRHGNEVLLEYMASGNLQSSNYTKEDIYWGQLGGCLESINAGTTAVVDHSHINCFPGAATASSGLRCIYGYCPTPRVASWSPFTLDQDVLAPWVMKSLEDLAKRAPFGDGREAGVKLATTHTVRNAQTGMADLVEQVKSLGLLDSSMLFSHANGISAESIQAIADAGAHISSTPSTEMQMAVGFPVCLDDDLPHAQKQSSLGVDCHSNHASSIIYEMRLALQASRAKRNQKILDQGKAPKHISKAMEEAFNLGTIQGARAIGMEDKIGSIAEGKLADLVIFDANSPEMLCAAEQDPVAAIVLHSSIANVETVIVDGIIRKRGGKLMDVAVEEEMETTAGKISLRWREIADALRRSRKELLEREAENQNLDEVKQGVISSFYIDESKLVG